MTCISCTKTLPIPQCSEILLLGAVDIIEGNAIITEIKTGRSYALPVIVELGVASLDLTPLTDFLTPNFEYQVQLFDGETLDTYGTPVEITINDVVYTCLQLNFTKVVNSSTGEIEGAAAIQIKIYD